MQFCDGNRLDLTLVDTRNVETIRMNYVKYLLIKMLNLKDIAYKGFYTIAKPSQHEFDEAVNEFWWMSVV